MKSIFLNISQLCENDDEINNCIDDNFGPNLRQGFKFKNRVNLRPNEDLCILYILLSLY